MSGSYRQCSDCGKRALSIATRCPGCGRELPSPESPDRQGGGPSRIPSVQSLLGLLAVAAALVAGWEARRRGAISNDESSYVATAERAEPVEAASPLASAPLAATPRLDTASPGRPIPAQPAVPAPGRPSPSPAAAADTGRLLVARTWTNVRNRRSVKGGLEAVLMPGDTVLADSLSHGWYRVALEGEVMGYAFAPTLASGEPGSSQ
jgi:hypothetical protein